MLIGVCTALFWYYPDEFLPDWTYPATVKQMRTWLVTQLREHQLSANSGVAPDVVEQELISNIIFINGNAPTNDADIYQWRQTGLELMEWTEDETDTPAWISMGLADIALRALLIPGI